MVSGRGPSLASLHHPPRPLAILIYGNASSAAIAAVSKDDFSSTLAMVGHKVSKCASTTDCASALASEHYDVVLADPSDAATLKATGTSGILPVMVKPSKVEVEKLKGTYAETFDASRDPLRLLPILVKLTKAGH